MSFGDPDVAWLVLYWRRGSFRDAAAAQMSGWTQIAPEITALSLPRVPAAGTSIPRVVPAPLAISLNPGETVSFFLVPGNGNWIVTGLTANPVATPGVGVTSRDSSIQIMDGFPARWFTRLWPTTLQSRTFRGCARALLLL